MIPANLPARLAVSAANAFPELGADPLVAIERVLQRPRSTLIRCSVGSGQVVRLVVKIPRLIDRPPSGRPRIVPDTPPLEKAVLEAAALRAIDVELRAEPDPRLGTVRIIDSYEDLGAIVMTEAEGVPLSGLLVRAVGRRTRGGGTTRLVRALGNAGAWLRRYQALGVAAERPARLATRAAIVEQARLIGEFLAPRSSRPGDVSDLVARFVEAAAATLPDEVPLGLHHGDFAVRNLLIGVDGHVTAIDALGRWRMPIHDDLARMIVAIETSRIQSSSFGLAFSPAQLTALGDALLSGYGSDRVDPHAVRVYAVLILLDRWAARADRRSAGGRRFGRMSDALGDRRYDSVARRLLAPPSGEGG